jgi:hypothetical protein
MLPICVVAMLSQAPSAPPLVAAVEPPGTRATLSPEALERYRQASTAVIEGRFSEATASLNALAASYPQVPEVFAARCSAQLGLRQFSFAEADCAYALRLNPALPTARAGLDQARAGLTPRAAPVPAQPAPEPRRPRPTCLMGTDGQQACGYHCQMGTNGVVACADTADGVCAMGTDGRITCSRVGASGGYQPGVKPECRMGTDGRNTCGYHCQMGTNGHIYCASSPDGTCAMNTNGTWTCS